jgi:DNA-binding beta-propeller fold protein YncE
MLGLTVSVRAVDGVIPNLTYPTNVLFQQISPQLSTNHLNQPSVFNGYLILAGNAVHEVWDIANPYAPIRKAIMTSPHGAGEAESHQVTYGRLPNGTTYMATTSGRGVDIWNVTVTTNPVLVAAMQLPNINYGDVSGGIWGLSWQGKYLYLGATTFGLYVVDVSNPAQPQLVTTFTTSQLGGAIAGPLFALGNLLVVTSPKGYHTIATVDISEPANPRLLDAETGGASSYIGGFYGGNAYLITPLRTFDVTTDPRNIQLLASTSIPASEYVSFADQYLFLGGLRGGTEGIYKYSITNPVSPALIGRYVGRNTLWDDQFSCPIGNLLAISDDQNVNGYVGGLLAVHDVNPDTKPPTVLKVYPANGAVNQPLTTRVAVSMSEWPELATVNAASFIVRPEGGQPLAGSWGCTYTTLNFSPDAPLLPNSDYEILLPAGGVRDLVGNAVGAPFVATFRTGSGVIPTPPGVGIAPVAPTQLGNATTLALANPPVPGVLYTWNFGDGATNTGSPVTHTYTAPGRYSVTMSATVFNSYLEAENAQMSGGVVAANNNPGYSGTGFADFPTGTGPNIFVRWTLTNETARTVNLQFRYACQGVARPLNLVINGGTTNLLNFPGTALWTTYSNVLVANVTFVAGTNTIELQATAGSQGPNVDTLIVPVEHPEPTTTSFQHIVHRALTTQPPTQSQPMALDSVRQILWVANPDTDTVTALNSATLAKRGEYAVGKKPETLSIATDGTLWVANHDSATISVLNTNGALVTTIALPRASQPYGLAFTPNGSNAVVALQALGRVVKLDSASHTIVTSLDLPPDPNGIRPQIRGVAISADGSQLFVTRFVSPSSGGQVFEINPVTMTLTRTISLANDPGPDTPISGRGIPNYLNALAISPDGARVWLPSKKDNLSRGVLRDGNHLNHDMTVRCITSVFDPVTGAELLSERVDYDNQDRAHAVCFSALGDLAFVSMPGNNLVKVVDTYSGESVSELPTAKAPTGILFDAATRRIFVLNFLSRSVSAFDVNDLVSGLNNTAVSLGAPVSLVAVEALPANVLRGKELFYDATSTRLNEEAYMSCASCHLDGGSDGRVWDFTGFGEGLRNTIELRGRAGTTQGRLHWSANFDEVQDFEGQIRTFGAGTGLMENSSFASGNRSHPLGLAKYGISDDLDALAAYVASLDKVPSSPHRNADGTLTSDAVTGRTLFNQLNCHACHGGEQFTDSPQGAMHNVGTLKPSSGQRLNAPLNGLDTPTLRGVWATAPYLHDGSAPTLLDVLTTANPTNAHGNTSGLTMIQLNQLVAYLNQIDDIEPAALPASGLGLPSFTNYLATYALSPGANAAHGNPDADAFDNLMEFALGGSNPTNGASRFAMLVASTASTVSNGAFQFSYLRLAGGYWLNGSYRMGELEYQTDGSGDLFTWNLPLIQTINPAGLMAPPPGYEWVTFRADAATPATNQGFGRVKAVLRQ